MMTHEQKQVALKLAAILTESTDVGLLDVLLDHTKNPDSINDVCDSLNDLLKE